MTKRTPPRTDWHGVTRVTAPATVGAKTTGKGTPETYFTMTLEGAFITKVSNSGTEEGNVLQRVELVFKTVKIDYKPQNPKDGTLGAARTYNWDIPAGTASPSA